MIVLLIIMVLVLLCASYLSYLEYLYNKQVYKWTNLLKLIHYP